MPKTTTTPSAAAERARMAAIMDLPGADAFPRLAGALAVGTGMSPQTIGATLEAAAGRGAFAHLNTPQARVGLQSWQEGSGHATVSDAAAAILNAGRGATPPAQ